MKFAGLKFGVNVNTRAPIIYLDAYTIEASANAVSGRRRGAPAKAPAHG